VNALDLVNAVLRDKLKFSNEAGDLSVVTGEARSILRALNEIKDELLERHEFPSTKKKGTLTLATGMDTYPLASDVNRPLSFYYARDFSVNAAYPKFNYVGDDEFLDHEGINTTEGLPYIGRSFGQDGSGHKVVQVYFVPSSGFNGSSLYYDYVRSWPDAAANADLFPFPDSVMIEGAFMKRRSGAGTMSTEDFKWFNDLVQQHIRNTVKGTRKRIPYRDI